MTLIFIDGPLVEETKPWPNAPPRFQTMLPKRITHCNCNPDFEDEIRKRRAGIFTYFRVLVGESMALYSKYSRDEDVLKSVKSWVVSDLSKDWHFGCRDRRAFQ